MNTRSIKLALASLFAALAIGSVYYVFNLLTSDNLKFRKGDFAYMLIVRSNVIHDFPTFDVIKEGVSFVYSARDGTAPEEIIMSYDSAASIDDLLQKYRAHCADQNYSEVPEEDFLMHSRLACDAPDYRIEIDFQLPRYDATRVTVSFLGTQV